MFAGAKLASFLAPGRVCKPDALLLIGCLEKNEDRSGVELAPEDEVLLLPFKQITALV